MDARLMSSCWTMLLLGMFTSPTSRAEDVFSEFTLAGGPTSHLFSKCIEDAMTVEGSLYSISVSGDEDYERFSPEVMAPMLWTDVELEDNSDIFDCAMAAYNLSALMFKYEDGCSVTLSDTYNPNGMQNCGDMAEGLVFISSRVRSMNFFGEVLVDGDTLGCVSLSEDGWVYGVNDGRVVDEDTLPSRDTCCTSAAADYCLVAECNDEPMTYCEAEARCLARGLRAASRQFHETIDVVDPTKLGTDEYYFWVNVYQNELSEWKWLDDGSNFTDYVCCSPPSTNNSTPTKTATTTTNTTTTTKTTTTKNCAAIHFTDEAHHIEYYRTECNGTEVKCVLCYDPKGVLPAC